MQLIWSSYPKYILVDCETIPPSPQTIQYIIFGMDGEGAYVRSTKFKFMIFKELSMSNWDIYLNFENQMLHFWKNKNVDSFWEISLFCRLDGYFYMWDSKIRVTTEIKAVRRRPEFNYNSNLKMHYINLSKFTVCELTVSGIFSKWPFIKDVIFFTYRVFMRT